MPMSTVGLGKQPLNYYWIIKGHLVEAKTHLIRQHCPAPYADSLASDTRAAI